MDDTPSAGRNAAEDERLRPRGSNSAGMRQFNERVVLQAIRLHGSLPKAEIARVTRLTAQTVQVIIARLEADGLVRKLAPVRGKVKLGENRYAAACIEIEVCRATGRRIRAGSGGRVRG